MHKPESVENEMHENLWDFKILMDCLTQAWRPDLVLINLRKLTVAQTPVKYHQLELM